jgi:hypothetical protein
LIVVYPNNKQFPYANIEKEAHKTEQKQQCEFELKSFWVALTVFQKTHTKFISRRCSHLSFSRLKSLFLLHHEKMFNVSKEALVALHLSPFFTIHSSLFFV